MSDLTYDFAVNELSNTMELMPILSRAEALFARFEKKVEAIDKKYNFPKPPVRQRKRIESASQPTTNDSSANNQQNNANTRRPTNPTSSRPQPQPQRDSASTTGAQSSAGSSSRQTGPNSTSKPDTEPYMSRVITPELRNLLSRKVEVMDAKEVRERSDGTG